MPLDIRIRFGRAIRRIREEQKINQEEAAERCGLSISFTAARLTPVSPFAPDTAVLRHRATPLDGRPAA